MPRRATFNDRVRAGGVSVESKSGRSTSFNEKKNRSKGHRRRCSPEGERKAGTVKESGPRGGKILEKNRHHVRVEGDKRALGKDRTHGNRPRGKKKRKARRGEASCPVSTAKGEKGGSTATLSWGGESTDLIEKKNSLRKTFLIRGEGSSENRSYHAPFEGGEKGPLWGRHEWLGWLCYEEVGRSRSR